MPCKQSEESGSDYVHVIQTESTSRHGGLPEIQRDIYDSRASSSERHNVYVFKSNVQA